SALSSNPSTVSLLHRLWSIKIVHVAKNGLGKKSYSVRTCAKDTGEMGYRACNQLLCMAFLLSEHCTRQANLLSLPIFRNHAAVMATSGTEAVHLASAMVCVVSALRETGLVTAEGAVCIVCVQ
ncbi:unnamed protein product, partial [Ectocarpus sp. 12 AP-2014]